MQIRSLMVVFSHNLVLLHLGIQLLGLILVMHILLSLASLFNSTTSSVATLADLGNVACVVGVPTPMQMYCDNQAAIYIASNLVFHEHTKDIEVDCHFIQDLLMKKQIVILFVRSDD